VARIDPRRVQCFYGAEASDSACPGLAASGAELVMLPGGHHFGGDYAALAARESSARRRAPDWPARRRAPQRLGLDGQAPADRHGGNQAAGSSHVTVPRQGGVHPGLPGSRCGSRMTGTAAEFDNQRVRSSSTRPPVTGFGWITSAMIPARSCSWNGLVSFGISGSVPGGSSA
jgi:Bacterial virulence protein (VirJ)